MARFGNSWDVLDRVRGADDDGEAALEILGREFYDEQGRARKLHAGARP